MMFNVPAAVAIVAGLFVAWGIQSFQMRPCLLISLFSLPSLLLLSLLSAFLTPSADINKLPSILSEWHHKSINQNNAKHFIPASIHPSLSSSTQFHLSFMSCHHHSLNWVMHQIPLLSLHDNNGQTRFATGGQLNETCTRTGPAYFKVFQLLQYTFIDFYLAQRLTIFPKFSFNTLM